MPKQQLKDERYDFRGGLNTIVSPDALNANEQSQMTNARLFTSGGAGVGGMTKRNGTRRMHSAALAGGGRITQLIQWDAPLGKQLVAIGTNGHLYYRDFGTGDFGAFTDVTPGTLFNNTGPAAFAVMRAASAGAALRLYIGDSGVFYRWSGSALTLLTAGGGALDNADLLASYHTRLFAHQLNFHKLAMWSKVGDPESFTASGVSTDGGSAIVSTLNAEQVIAYEVVGSSLIMATTGGVSRFTGYSTDDIRLASDSEGISSEVGAVGPLALKRFETAAAMLSKRGPYAITEAGAVPIGIKILPDFQGLNQNLLNFGIVAYHKGRKELWFAVSGPNDSGAIKTIYVYSVELQAWSGPFQVPFDIRSMTSYQRVSDSTDTIIAGCGDGFIRDLDTGSSEDVLFDGSGGSAITMTVEVATHLFNGGGTIKALDTIELDTQMATGGVVTVQTNADNAGFVSQGTVTQVANGVPETNRLDLNDQGKRIRLQFVSSSFPVTIHGYTIYAWDMNRR